MAAKTVDLTFGLGSDPVLGSYYAEDIEVLPGQPNSIVVSRQLPGASPRHRGVAVYDEGVMRPNTTPAGVGSNSLAFAGGELYGLNNETAERGLRRLILSENGVTQGSVYTGLVDDLGTLIEGRGNFLYTNKGERIGVAGDVPTLVGSYNLSNGVYPSGVEPVPDLAVVYFLTAGFGDEFVLRTFNTTTYAITMTPITITNLRVNAHQLSNKLINWGDDRKLAFHTNRSLVILRNCTSLATDDPLPLTAPEGPICFGDTLSYSAPSGYNRYFWETGDTSQTISLTNTTRVSYQTIDSSGCLGPRSNSGLIQFEPIPTKPVITYDNLFPVFCQGETISLFAPGNFSTTHVWSNGVSGTSVIQVDSAGTYQVTAISNGGCVSPISDPITITESNLFTPSQPVITVEGGDTTLCNDEVAILSVPSGFAFYQWNGGDTTSSIEVSSTRFNRVRVANEAGCLSDYSPSVYITKSVVNQPTIYQIDDMLFSSPSGSSVVVRWFLNGVLLETNGAQVLTPVQTGTYTAQNTRNDCLSPLSDPFFFISTGIEETRAAGGITLYPQPG